MYPRGEGAKSDNKLTSVILSVVEDLNAKMDGG